MFDNPVLTSSRLVIRALRDDDCPHLLEMAHDPDVVHFLNEGPLPSAEDIGRRISGARAQWARLGYGMMAVETSEGFIGRAGIHHPQSSTEPQLSYIFSRSSWGKGYATEACTVTRDWMFATHRPSRLISHIAPENAASARVAAKLGGVREGTTHQNGVILDVWRYTARIVEKARQGG